MQKSEKCLIPANIYPSVPIISDGQILFKAASILLFLSLHSNRQLAY